MKRCAIRLVVLGLSLGLASAALAQQDPIEAELDAYWAEVVRAVVDWDLEEQENGYHPDGISVMGEGDSYTTTLVASFYAMLRADPDFQPPVNHGLEFHFSRRVHDEETAHEVGMYHFWADGRDDFYGTVEAYLVKKEGRWLSLVGIQRGEAGRSKAEWDALLAGVPVSDLLEQLAHDFAAAEVSNDVDAALAYLWEDAVMQPPGAPQIQGHEAIRALYDTVTFVSLELGPLTTVVSGDLAVLWGSMSAVLEGPDGPITNEGKHVTVWQRRGGEWKVLENSWNSSLPPSGQ